MERSVCAIGDAVLDVIVELSQLPVVGDDVPGAVSVSNGGQASNVAAWCRTLGARSAVISKLGTDVAGGLVADLMERRGVGLLGPRAEPGREATGTIVSLVTPGGERSMISDRGAAATLGADDLEPTWFRTCDWLHVSGYSLFGSDGGAAALAAASYERQAGGGVSVDVSAATLIESVGVGEARRRIAQCRPDVVFANLAEHRVLGALEGIAMVVKRGAAGFVVHDSDGATPWDALDAADVRDTTGAGDAFAAGWILGGPEMARAAARECLACVGAMPPLEGLDIDDVDGEPVRAVLGALTGDAAGGSARPGRAPADAIGTGRAASAVRGGSGTGGAA